MATVTEKKKRSARWSEEEANALLSGIEKHVTAVLGSFSSQVTASSRREAWVEITAMVSFLNKYELIHKTNCFINGLQIVM